MLEKLQSGNPDERRRMLNRILLALLIIVVVMAADQATKWVVRENLVPGQSVPVIGPLSWTLITNTGSAFGMFQNHTAVLAGFSVVSLVLMIFLFRYFMKASIIAPLSLAMVFAGASSNLIDRIVLGEVTDFIDVLLFGDTHFPFFNIADSSISIGAILLMVFILFMLPREKKA